MSAFVVNYAHIDAIVNFASSHAQYSSSLGSDLPRVTDGQALGELLIAENIRSVDYRYHERNVAVPYHWLPGCAIGIAATAFLKLLACLQYQSCETPDYEQTRGYRALLALRTIGIQALPGYDDADWEYPDEDQRLAVEGVLEAVED